MARAYCLLKPGAKALVGVPTGADTICHNGYKIYGPKLYKHLFANWVQVFSEVDTSVFEKKVNCRTDYKYQPMHIIEKPVN